MDKRTEGILHILFAIVIVALVLYFSSNIEKFKEFGYLGAFVISMLSSATIFIPAPGWMAIIAMGRYLDPMTLGIVAGVGSAIGELTGYVAGDGARDIINDKIKENKNTHKLITNYGPLAIFVLAFIPNPLFDAAGLVAGALKLPWWQFLIATGAGRVLRYILLAMLGAWTLGLIS